MSKVLAKVVHLAVGLDLLASKTSLSAKRGSELEVTALGIKAHSSNGRVVLIPWPNVKGCELFPEPKKENAKTDMPEGAPAIYQENPEAIVMRPRRGRKPKPKVD